MSSSITVPARDFSELENVLSAPRIKPFLDECGGDRELALAYYEWNTRMASEAMTSIAHLEIVVRNAMDRELSAYFRDAQRGIPWFAQERLNERQQKGIDGARERLRKEERMSGGTHARLRETRDQVIAGQTLGFWDSLLVSEYQELWNQCLHKAFPHSSGRRNDVHDALVQIRRFRNKLAHHDSLRSANILLEMERIFDTAGWVATEAEGWMRALSRWKDVYSECPVKTRDVVIVAGNVAWDIYRETGFYACRAGRYFRDVQHLGFYESSSIRAEIPKIMWIKDEVEWSQAQADRLLSTSNREDKKLGRFINWCLNDSELQWEQPKYKVFRLTRPGDLALGHLTLPQDIPHYSRGRGSAFVQGQRYVSKRDLPTAASTADLEARS